MKNKKCQVICDGKEIATFNCADSGCSVKWTKEGKEICKEFCKDFPNGCC